VSGPIAKSVTLNQNYKKSILKDFKINHFISMFSRPFPQRPRPIPNRPQPSLIVFKLNLTFLIKKVFLDEKCIFIALF